jgi:predicted nucleotidyltransferase
MAVGKAFLRSVRACLEKSYKKRFKGAVLYGSQARGTATSESDLDLLVLLEGPVQLGRDLHKAVGALYPLQLGIRSPIHVLPVDAGAFEAGMFALYRHAKKEGIFI